jgi:LysR family transcriptional regulator, low CO2-responsive transcriptional regulator
MFCAVARHGSLAGAARQLHLTPSALSHALKSLETQLGCRLFGRTGKRMLLNQAGEQLLAQVEGPLNALDDAEDSIKRLAKWGQTRLRIGAAASACEYVLPPVIRELKKSFSNVTFQVESADMPEAVERLLQNRIDLALGVAPPVSLGLDMRPVFTDELLFVFAPSHPWAAGDGIALDDLKRQPLILYQRSSLTARMVEDYFRRLDIVPSTVMEMGSIAAIKELVRLKLGVSVLAPWAVGADLARGTLQMRPLGTRPLKRHWVVAWPARRRLSLVEETFCRLCRNVGSGLRMDRRDVPALSR